MPLNIFNVDGRPESLEKKATLSMNLTTPPEEWDQEILQIAYKQHPWLADFTVTLDFIKKIPDRQYGIGGLTVYAKMPAGVKAKGPSGQDEPPTGPVLAHIPIIVKENQLQPLDLFIADAKVYPLEENVFRRVTSSGMVSRSTTNVHSDPTIIGYLWPTGRTTFGGPSTELGMSLLSKFASDRHDYFYLRKWLEKAAEDTLQVLSESEGYPLISMILSGEVGSSREKAASFLSKIKNSAYLSHRFGDSVEKIANAIPARTPRRGSVVQIVKTASGVAVRSTYPEAFEFGPLVPVDAKLSTNDTFLVETSLRPQAFLAGQATKTASELSTTGISKVVLNNEKTASVPARLSGYVFPRVTDFDGTRRSESLFFSKSADLYSLSDDLQYAEVSNVAAAVPEPVAGTGVFFFKGAEGVECTPPVTIIRKDTSISGPVFFAKLHSTKLAGDGIPMDLDVKMYITKAVQMPTFIKKTSSLMIPAEYSWKSIGAQNFKPVNAVQYEKNILSVTKIASNEFELTGTPVEKVVSRHLDAGDTQFVLAAAGVPKELISKVINSYGTTKLANCRILQPKKKVTVSIPEFDGLELMKAASEVDDPNTVDSVLGLNLADFSVEDDYITVANALEDAQQRVARLLLLNRLGMYSIPEGAAKLVMMRLTPIIDALKVMALQHAYKES